MVAQAGAFDRPVRLLRPDRVRDALGAQTTITWRTLGEPWANVAFPAARQDAREVDGGARPASERVLRFKLRGLYDLADGDVILFEDEPYQAEGFFLDRRKGETTATGRFLAGSIAITSIDGEDV